MRKNKVTATIFSILLMASLLGLIITSKPVSATPTTIQVPLNYPTIQEAINHANLGDTILVAAGTYQESVVINQSITLMGSGKNVTFLKGLSNWSPVINVKISNVNITKFTIQNGPMGVSVLGYNAINISDNRIISNRYEGIDLEASRNSTVVNNIISSNGLEGVLLQQSNSSTVSSNIISSNGDGVVLVESSNNRITNNTIVFQSSVGASGICLDYFDTPYSSFNNVFERNSIANNSIGVLIYLSNDNLFYHNNFINNTIQVATSDSTNSWNATTEGNYWSDYTGKDDDSNGIGDSPYVIDSTNRDNFPLMSPWVPPKDVTPPITTDDYEDVWHTENFTINLKAFDLSGVEETYYRYKINDEPIYNVSVNGQPYISTEGSNNTLEYWSIDKVGNEETHHYLINIKLDKTSPSGSIQINQGDAYTTSLSVTINLYATDVTSGVAQMCFSNNGATWSDWEPYVTSKSWGLTLGDGVKTVYVIYLDNADLNSQTYNDTTVLDTAPPIVSILSPSPGVEIKSQSLTISWNGTDAGSGIDHYELRLDAGSWINVGNEKTHTFTGLNEGGHTVYVKAVDKVGWSNETSVSFVVNTSPIGAAGYIEEAALIVIAVVAIGIVVLIIRLRKKHRLKS